jgi:hypothetical protein
MALILLNTNQGERIMNSKEGNMARFLVIAGGIFLTTISFLALLLHFTFLQTLSKLAG